MAARFLSLSPSLNANAVCFERELLDHYRIVFEPAWRSARRRRSPHGEYVIATA
jgi:hypothetical protein